MTSQFIFAHYSKVFIKLFYKQKATYSWADKGGSCPIFPAKKLFFEKFLIFLVKKWDFAPDFFFILHPSKINPAGIP